MPATTLEPVSPELMLDTLDHGKLRLHDAHFKAIDLLLKQAGKADADNEIAECRRCCVAILNFEITYPPKHAFFPPSSLPADENGASEPDEETTPATTVAPASPPLPLPGGAGGGRGEGATPETPQSIPTLTPHSQASSEPSSPGGRAAVARGAVSAANQPLESPVESSPPPGRASAPLDPSPATIPTSEQPSSPTTPNSSLPPPPPPEPPAPYEPTGELWDPSIDKEAWYRKYMHREPYKPYIHRNYLYILLMALSLIFNSSPTFALGAHFHALPGTASPAYLCAGHLHIFHSAVLSPRHLRSNSNVSPLVATPMADTAPGKPLARRDAERDSSTASDGYPPVCAIPSNKRLIPEPITIRSVSLFSNPRRHESSMSKTESTTCARLPGRPRCDETARSILKAAFDLLKTHGLAALTMEGVAAKAGVGKATVYRWWPNRAALAVDAFFAEVSPRIPFEDTGSVRGDFRAQMHRVVTEMNGRGGKVLMSISAAAQMDEDVAHAFRTRWLVPRRAEGMEAIKRGIARGELPADIDSEFLFDLLYSPLYFRLLIRHQPLTHEFADRVLTVGFAGLNPRVRTPTPTRRRRPPARSKSR